MKKVSEFKSRNLRRDRNTDLVRRMRNGESLSSFNSYASWFPPRPVIEKDSDALHKLYGEHAVSITQRVGDSELQGIPIVKPLRLA